MLVCYSDSDLEYLHILDSELQFLQILITSSHNLNANSKSICQITTLARVVGMSKNEENKSGSGNIGEKSTDEKREIQQIRADVDKLSTEIKNAIGELKKSIVDIRSAVSEIENPFNLLRVVSSEGDLKKLENARLPPGIKSLIIGKPEETERSLEVEENQVVPESRLEETPPGVKLPIREEEKKPAEQPGPILKPSGAAYLDWVWSLLDLGFNSDDVGQMAQSYELLGFIPEGSSRQIYSLAVAAEKARSKGFDKGLFLLNMYEASAISGKQMSTEDLKRLMSIVEKIMKEAKMAERVE